jgi:spermidine synthase
MAALFASGAASLILELVWTRQFELVFGSTESALSMVLAAYMAGLAVGSFRFGKRCRRWRNPLWLYAALESGIAVSALVLTPGIAHLENLLAVFGSSFVEQPLLLGFLRFLLAFVIVAIPTTLMGGTLPVLCQAVSGANQQDAGRPVGLLYSANLAGAVAGALAAGFWLIPSVGILRTALSAVALSALAAAIGASAARLAMPSRLAPDSDDRPLIVPPKEASGMRLRKAVLVCMAVSGIAALLEEVLWFRSLRLVLGSSTYALTVMLLTFLIGLALGSYLIALVSRRLRSPLQLLAWLQGATFLSLLVAVYLYPRLPGLFLRSYSAFGAGSGIFLVQAAVAALVLLPSTVLLGAMFPLSARAVAFDSGSIGLEVGILYAVLTAGNVLGAVLATTWLTSLGLSGGLLAAGVLHVAAGLWLLWTASSRTNARWTYSVIMVAGLVLAPWIRQQWQPLLSTSGVFQNVTYSGNLFTRPEEFFEALSVFHVLYYEEGKSATVSVYEEPTLDASRHLSLAIDGKADASTGDDMPTQELLGHLPLLLAPQTGEVCVIGWGSGVTAGSVLTYPVPHVTAIEIEPAVLRAARLFDEFNHHASSNPRLRVVVNDARAVLMRESRRYQTIISEPSNPWLAGPSKLFTREFLEVGKSRLQPGGIFTQWIHLYGLDSALVKMFLRTFHSVFPHVLAFQATAGDLILLGSDAPLKMDPDRIATWLEQPRIAQDLERIGVSNLADVLQRFRFGDQELPELAGSGPLNTDSLPALEFGAARTLYQDTLLDNQTTVLEAYRGLGPYLAAGDPDALAVSVALRALRRGDEPVARMFAARLQGQPRESRALWLQGELAWRLKDLHSAEGWWMRGLAVDSNCLECAISLALLRQGHGGFAESNRMLAGFKEQGSLGRLLSLVEGVNLFYLGQRPAALPLLRAAIESPHDSVTGDMQALIESDLYPIDVLASFYFAEAGGNTGPGVLDTLLESWRLRLFKDPGLGPWDRLLSQIEFHSGRAQAAKAEQMLLPRVIDEVLEPLVHYNRGIRAAQLGKAAEAQKEFAAAAERVKDSGGRQRLLEALQKLTGRTLSLSGSGP